MLGTKFRINSKTHFKLRWSSNFAHLQTTSPIYFLSNIGSQESLKFERPIFFRWTQYEYSSATLTFFIHSWANQHHIDTTHENTTLDSKFSYCPAPSPTSHASPTMLDRQHQPASQLSLQFSFFPQVEFSTTFSSLTDIDARNTCY